MKNNQNRQYLRDKDPKEHKCSLKGAPWQSHSFSSGHLILYSAENEGQIEISSLETVAVSVGWKDNNWDAWTTEEEGVVKHQAFN